MKLPLAMFILRGLSKRSETQQKQRTRHRVGAGDNPDG